LPDTAKLIAGELLDRFSLDTGQCNLSRSEAGRFLNMSISTFSLSVEALEKEKMLFVVRYEKQTQISNEYGFNWDLLKNTLLLHQGHGAWAEIRKYWYENHTSLDEASMEIVLGWYENHTRLVRKAYQGWYENHTLTREDNKRTKQENQTSESNTISPSDMPDGMIEVSESIERKTTNWHREHEDDLNALEALALCESPEEVQPTPKAPIYPHTDTNAFTDFYNDEDRLEILKAFGKH
jgi:hypothetical protein